eukprot:4464468-Alexandrium_andersonii.AAC.1
MSLCKPREGKLICIAGISCRYTSIFQGLADLGWSMCAGSGGSSSRSAATTTAATTTALTSPPASASSKPATALSS